MSGRTEQRDDLCGSHASLDELLTLAWLPDAVAQAVHDKIHRPTR